MLNPNAIIPYMGGDLAKRGAQKVAKEMAEKMATKTGSRLSTALGSGVASKLAKHSGSALDGILGKSSGVVLPQPERKPLDYYLGGSIADAFERESGALDDDFVKDYLKPQVRDDLRGNVREFVEVMRPTAHGETDDTFATRLPKIRTSDYYQARGLKGQDVPEYMRPYLSEKNGRSLTQSDWTEIFGDAVTGSGEGAMSLSPDEILDRYDRLLDNDFNARDIYTDENYANYFKAFPDEAKRFNEPFLRAFETSGGENLVKVKREGGKAYNIPVTRGKVQGLVPEAKPVQGKTPAVQNILDRAIQGVDQQGIQDLSDAKSMFGDMKQKYGDQPKIGVFGEEVPPIQVNVGKTAQGSTRAQRGARSKTEMWINSFGSVPKASRQELYKKYDGFGPYKSMADRLMARNIDPANLQDVVEKELADIEELKRTAMEYAERAGVTVDLSGVPAKLSLSKMQRQRLEELGLGLEGVFGEGARAVAPREANQLYMTLRDMGYKLSKSLDPTYQLAGDACYDVARKIGEALDDTMDNVAFNYKAELVQLMADAGDDPRVIREIAKSESFKFSDLRKEQAPFMTAKDMIGLKLPKDETINMFGFDTGIPNPAPGIADKVKGKYYDWQARSGEGAGGIPPKSPDIEVTTGGQAPRNMELLKDAGLVGGGALLGGLLSGGGQQAQAPEAPLFEEEAPEEAMPQEEPTLLGYTYADLEQAYALAMMDGNPKAANSIAGMMDVLGARLKAMQKDEGQKKGSAGVNALKELYKIYQSAGGSQGILRGGATNALNKVSGGAYNPDVANYEAIKEATSAMIIRALGEKGALSDRDRETVAKSLPNITDAPEVAERKFRSLYDMLMTAQE